MSRWWWRLLGGSGGAAPDDPTVLTATFVSVAQIDLAWTDNATNESGYKIERKVGAGSFVEIAAIATVDLAAYSDNSVVQDAVYTYRVRAYKGSQNSGYSNEATAETLPQAPQDLAVELITSATAPAAPSVLTVTFNAQDDIELNWTDNSNNETEFRVERSDDGAAFQEAQIVGPNVTTYTDTLIPTNTEVTYRVLAANAEGDSAYSNEDSTVTLPGTPTTLVATAADEDTINLTWDNEDVTLEDEFKIERKTGAGAYAQIDTVAAGVLAYQDTGLDPATNYTYRVRGSNAVGNGNYSNVTSDTTDAAPTAPNVPTNFVPVFVSNSRVDMTWAAGSANATLTRNPTSDISEAGTLSGASAGTRYTLIDDHPDSVPTDAVTFVSTPAVLRMGHAAFTVPVGATSISLAVKYYNYGLTTTQCSAKALLLINSVEYFAVSHIIATTTPTLQTDTFPINPATSAAWTVDEVNGVGITGLDGFGVYTPDAAPDVLVSSVQLSVAYTGPAEDGFKIERSDDGGVFTQIAAGGATSYSDTTVAVDTVYVYRMRAHNDVGNSPYTPEETVYTLPGAPTSLTATAVGDTQIQLAWTDNSNIEDAYRVERKTGAGSFAFLGSGAADSEGYSDTGLAASTTYTYRVYARRSAAADSTFSNEANATTAGGENLTVFAGNYPTGFTVVSGEIGVISGTVTSAANVIVHGTLRMRPGSTLRFTGINNATWSFDPPDATHEPDVSDVGLWLHGNATLDAIGSEKTPWLRATGSLAAAATTISVGDQDTLAAFNPVNWQPGDELLISPTAIGDYDAEIRVIQSVSGNTVTLTSGLTKAHPSVVVGDRTFAAEICNLTRDVRIEGTSATQTTHIMFMDHDPPLGGVVPQTIKYVQLRYIGMFNAAGARPDASGRYALHFHRLRNSYYGSLIEGVVVRDGQGHAFVSHETHGMTWRQCISHNTIYQPYWWDPVDPSIGPGGPSDKQITDFTMANDLFYDRCVAGRNVAPAGETDHNMGQFVLLRGTNTEIRGCVGFGRAGTRESATYDWPDGANIDPNVWIFEDNVAHNNRRSGARVWQNDGSLHPTDDFYTYHCGINGLTQGAYLAAGYRWNNLHIRGTGGALNSGIRQHAATSWRAGTNGAPREPDGYYHGYRNVTIDNVDYGVTIPRHQSPGTIPVLYYNIAFTNMGTAACHINEGENGGFNRGLYDFVNCTVDGLPMDETDIYRETTIAGSTVRIQNGASAISVDYLGAVTAIAVFYPKTGQWDPLEVI